MHLLVDLYIAKGFVSLHFKNGWLLDIDLCSMLSVATHSSTRDVHFSLHYSSTTCNPPSNTCSIYSIRWKEKDIFNHLFSLADVDSSRSWMTRIGFMASAFKTKSSFFNISPLPSAPTTEIYLAFENVRWNGQADCKWLRSHNQSQEQIKAGGGFRLTGIPNTALALALSSRLRSPPLNWDFTVFCFLFCWVF